MPKTNKKAKRTTDKAEIFENEDIVRHIKISEHSRITISVFSTDGESGSDVHFNIRKFYCTKADPTWKPARQGITLPVALMKKMRKHSKAIEEALEELDPEDIPALPAREGK